MLILKSSGFGVLNIRYSCELLTKNMNYKTIIYRRQ